MVKRTELVRHGGELTTKMRPWEVKNVTDYRKGRGTWREASILPTSVNSSYNSGKHHGDCP